MEIFAIQPQWKMPQPKNATTERLKWLYSEWDLKKTNGGRGETDSETPQKRQIFPLFRGNLASSRSLAVVAGCKNCIRCRDSTATFRVGSPVSLV